MKIRAQNTAGFTLVEAAIVLVIAGLVMTMLFNTLEIYTKNTRLSNTREKLEAVNQQLQLFLEQNGRFPCPASLTDAFDSTTYGFETASNCSTGAVTAGTFRTTGTGGRTIRMGMVPVRTLNLPDEFALDAWNNRIVYTVTEILASDPNDFDHTQGAISVVDGAGNNILPAAGIGHYVLVSSGREDTGGFSAGGGQIGDCTTVNNLDQENCNRDSIYRKTLLTSDAINNASAFDDLVVARAVSEFWQIPRDAIMGFVGTACPSGWVTTTQPSCTVNDPSGVITTCTISPTLTYCRKT